MHSALLTDFTPSPRSLGPWGYGYTAHQSLALIETITTSRDGVVGEASLELVVLATVALGCIGVFM